MDAALGLGFGNALHPVYTAFKLQAGIGALSGDGEAGLLDAAQFGIVEVEYLHLPAVALGIHGVHPHQRMGKQRCLLAAGTAPDLHDDILVVVGILGQQQDLQLLAGAVDLLLALPVLLLDDLPEIPVQTALLQQFRCLLVGVPGLFVLPVLLHNGGQVLVFLHQGAVLLIVADDRRIAQPCADVLIALLHS